MVNLSNANFLGYVESAMRFLPPEEQRLVAKAQARCLPEAFPAPGYLSPDLCTVLSLVLALPTYGYSLLLVPILWVAQYDRTEQRLHRLRQQLANDSVDPMEPIAAGAASETATTAAG